MALNDWQLQHDFERWLLQQQSFSIVGSGSAASRLSALARFLNGRRLKSVPRWVHFLLQNLREMDLVLTSREQMLYLLKVSVKEAYQL